MEIVVGRDPHTQKLCVIKDGVSRLYGQSVPMDVSRRHLLLQPLEDGRWILKNLNERNVTFVNGIAIESKSVSEQDKVELGNSRYLFLWDALQDPKEEVADIRPLKDIWKKYDNRKIEIQIADRQFNAARSATGVITMLAIACSFIFGHGPVYVALYALAIGISVVFTILAYRKSKEVPQQQRDLNKQFQQQYVCPKCGHFMGFQDYDILEQNDACAYCKTKFKK